MSSTQIDDFYGRSHDDGATVVSRFQFKGRIVGGDLPSPHHYLPDPCRLDTSVNTQTTLDLISMHTTFISEVGYTGAKPSIGDLVEVELEAGDVKFNLQYGTFKGIVNSAVISSESTTTNCASLSAEFRGFNPREERSTTGEIREIVPTDSVSIESRLQRISGPYILNPGRHKALPGAIAWVNAVMAAVNRHLSESTVSTVPHYNSKYGQNFRGCTGGATERTGISYTSGTPWKVTITSGYRSIASQDSAMMTLRNRNFGAWNALWGGGDHSGSWGYKAIGDWASREGMTNANVDKSWQMGKCLQNYSSAVENLNEGVTPNLQTPPKKNGTGWQDDVCRGKTSNQLTNCKELINWANYTWPHGVPASWRRNPGDAANTGAAADPHFRDMWIRYPSSGKINMPMQCYHIWILYGGRNWITEWLKCDYAEGGSAESLAVLNEYYGNNPPTKGHMAGTGFDISVSGGSMGTSANRDFLLDVIYNGEAEPEINMIPGIRDCYYHDGHLHLVAPPEESTQVLL